MIEQHAVPDGHIISHEISRLVITHTIPRLGFTRTLFEIIMIELNAEAWRKSVEIAIWTLGYGSYRVNDNTQGALWYYAHNIVYPTWADKHTTTAIIGGHTFQK